MKVSRILWDGNVPDICHMETVTTISEKCQKWEIQLDFQKVIRYNDCKVKGRRGANFEDFYS